MFIPPDNWLPAANYALARIVIFSTNLDTKRRVYLERHGGDCDECEVYLPERSEGGIYTSRSWYTIY